MGRRKAGAWRAPPLEAMLFGGLGVVMVALVFATPFNHDEDQYLAASVLAAKASLYRDFLYVQTPLQPELTAPLTRLAPGWTYLVLRLVSAACGMAALGGVWLAQLRLGVDRRIAGLSTLLMATCYTFQYCASVVRNDVLPMALLAWAIAAAASGLLGDARRSWRDWAASALLLAAAVSAKVSFAPLLAAAALFVCLRLAASATRLRWIEATGFGVGALAGLGPIAAAWLRAPEAVRFALVGFWADGPRRWYVANGLEPRMEPASKLLHGLGDLLLGPAFAALALALVLLSQGKVLRLDTTRPRPPLRSGGGGPSAGWWRGLAGNRRVELEPPSTGFAWSPAPAARGETSGLSAAALLDLMILAGLIAAFAPSPTFKQYFAPLLPPLFVRLGLMVSARRVPAWAKGLLALGAVTGVVMFAMRIGEAAWTGRWAPLVTARENRWVGDTLRRAHASGPIATLSAHSVLDSDYPLDPRFAGGAMVYRSADGVDPGLRRRLHITSPSSLGVDLDAEPPAAIVTGYEDGGGDTRVRLDQRLRAYALAEGYVLHLSPVSPAELYIRPQGARPVAR